MDLVSERVQHDRETKKVRVTEQYDRERESQTDRVRDRGRERQRVRDTRT